MTPTNKEMNHKHLWQFVDEVWEIPEEQKGQPFAVFFSKLVGYKFICECGASKQTKRV